MSDWDTDAPMDAAPKKEEDPWGSGGGDDAWGSSGATEAKRSYGGSGGGGNCFNCQQPGHRSNECPEPKKSRGCFNCGLEGHRSSDCPEPKKERSGGGGGSRACFNCSQEGHQSRDCPEPKKSGGGGGNRGCFNCGQEGHRKDDCPEPQKERNGGGSMTCHKCNEEGHMAKDCPTGGGSGCRRCKKEGHKAFDCTEEVVGEDGKPIPPIYKPQDLEDNDALFDQHISSGINFSKYEKIQVKVTGTDAPEPIKTFDEILESETIRVGIQKSNFTVPTPVQKYAIPILMAGRDLMACAQTGSGKTLAFLLPIIQGLFKNSADLGDTYGASCQQPAALIVTPTRELAIQIYTEAFKFCRGSILKPQIVYGGTSVGHQLAKLSGGCHILVATPGRLLDFMEKGKIGFEKLRYLVLDEADRMIDQGFLPEIRRMMVNSSMPKKGAKQMLMFSATFPEEIQRLAAEFLSDNYLFVAVGVVGAANSDVEQRLMKVEKFSKRNKLIETLGDSGITDRTMVFVEAKKTADFLASYLSGQGYKATSIHGDRYQSQREEALADFRTGRMPVLVATSVAARGLDIKDVRHVINYDMPKEIDEYVHRIGRTGRVGNVGMATSFFDPENPQDAALAPGLLKILKEAGQEVPEFISSAGGSGFSSGFNGANVTSDIRKGLETKVMDVQEDEWD